MKPERIQVRLSAGSARAVDSKILGQIREMIEEITGSPYPLGEMRDVDCTSANCLRLFGLGDLDPEWGRHLDLVVDVRSGGGVQWVSKSINGRLRKVWVRADELKAAAKDPELGQCAELVVTDCESLTDVGPLSGLTQLTSLDLQWCKSLTDVGPLSGLTQLTSLDLSSCKSLTDVGPLSGLMQLTSLNLQWCESLTDVGPLSGLTQLTSLAVSRCKSLTDVGPLSGLTQLTSLDLSSCEFLTDVGSLSGLTQLTSLDLSWCKSLTDVGPLSGLTQLTSLNLGFCSLTDVGSLSGLTQLTSLNLTLCESLTDVGLLSGLTQLTRLKLSGCEFLTDVGPLSGLTQLTSLNLRDCPYLGGERREATALALRGLDLTEFQFDDPDIRLEVLLSGAARRADRSRVRELFMEARTGLRLGKRPGLARAMAAAAGLGGVWADGAEGYRVLGGFLDDCLQLESIQGGPWCAMLESLAPKCSAPVAAWLDHLRVANPAGTSRLVAGLMDFIVAKGQLAGREWAPLVEPLLEQLNRPEQEELGPQIVLVWRTLGDRQRAHAWLKRLTDQHGMRFRDRVSIRLSLHDLERGECGTARRWLEELAEEGRGRLREADPVRMELAKALAGRLPVEAGQILASLVEEETRRGLAGDLLREPGFVGAAGNLERLMQILGTDANRFHELLDRLLREHPESEWVNLLRRELAPPAMAGITEALAGLLEDPRLADRMTRKDLQGLRAGLQGQADWVNTALREGLLAVLVHRRLLKPADSEEMRQEWNLPGSIGVAGENQ